MPLLLQRAAANAAQAPFLNLDEIRKHEGFGGVRIEDNVALLPGGGGEGGGKLLNLTVAAGRAPKVAAEIEAVMAAAREGGAGQRRR
jgi:hypothetical protein